MIQLGQFCGLRTHRAAICNDLGAFQDQDVDKAVDAVGGGAALIFPRSQHGLRADHPQRYNLLQNLILGFEVVVEMPARDIDLLRNVRKRVCANPC